MNTVIVPVDFSETSLHAARYAAKFFIDVEEVSIILYHSYSKASEQEEAQKKLDELKAELLLESNGKFEALTHQGDDFIDELERAVRHRSADLVVMGITGRNAIAQLFIGSNTLKMAQRKVCPVLIIPEKAEYKPVKNVMLSSDFNDTLNVTPSVPIKKVLNFSCPNLHIVNVDPAHYISITERYEKEQDNLREMFAEYNPEFHFMRLYDVDEALNLFAEEKKIDMIIAVQQNHSFLEKLYKRSRTQSLSYKSNVPILVVHE
ncbi:MAG TPA: universal stress protein [Segetibacter sp.]|jgi:nucleotide-binding universal stress UspA family protein